MNEDRFLSQPERHPSSLIYTLFKGDQADRDGNMEPEQMAENDRSRLEQAERIYKQYHNGDIELSAEDLSRLMILFHHGGTQENYEKALELARAANEAGAEDGAWLETIAEDRLMLEQHGVQKWGTQYDVTDNGLKRQPMMPDEESGVTDEMRERFGVFERQQQLEQKYGPLHE